MLFVLFSLALLLRKFYGMQSSIRPKGRTLQPRYRLGGLKRERASLGVVKIFATS